MSSNLANCVDDEPQFFLPWQPPVVHKGFQPSPFQLLVSKNSKTNLNRKIETKTGLFNFYIFFYTEDLQKHQISFFFGSGPESGFDFQRMSIFFFFFKWIVSKMNEQKKLENTYKQLLVLKLFSLNHFKVYLLLMLLLLLLLLLFRGNPIS